MGKKIFKTTQQRKKNQSIQYKNYLQLSLSLCDASRTRDKRQNFQNCCFWVSIFYKIKAEQPKLKNKFLFMNWKVDLSIKHTTDRQKDT